MPSMDRRPFAGAMPILLAVSVLATLAAPTAAAAAAFSTAAPQPSLGFRSALARLLGPQGQGLDDAGTTRATTGTDSASSTSATNVVGAATEPTAALPACRYRDELTRFHEVKHWRKTLLDTNLKIRRSYVPWDLVSVSRAGIAGTGKVRRVIIDDLAALAQAARRKGKPLAVRSAYRSYETQVVTFRSWVARSGYEQALKFSARPGHSEHQLGTTIDFTTAPGVPLSTSFGASPAGKWLARNAWRFGFLMSYPKGQRRVSCYGYEPWHFRYVGRDLARLIHESGQVPRRYLWREFESAP
jgi:D-alanyl-D-alanine carboxypeptidase